MIGAGAAARTGQLRPALHGQVAAVTGGARGIGLATAIALSRAGAQVIIGDLDGELAAGRARSFGGTGLPLDVRDDGSFRDFLDRIEERIGPLRILVNNAGVALTGAFLGTSASEHRLQIEVNLGGVERGMRLALPGMISRGAGHVVNLASAAGKIPAPGAAVYTATKHAVVGLTDAVRSELRGTGVHLTAVLPAAVTTRMSAGLRLRGLPQVAPHRVARAIVRVVTRRRRPAAVMVPGWLRPLAVIDSATPQWLRDLARGMLVVDLEVYGGSRRAYDERIARQLGNPPAAPPVA